MEPRLNCFKLHIFGKVLCFSFNHVVVGQRNRYKASSQSRSGFGKFFCSRHAWRRSIFRTLWRMERKPCSRRRKPWSNDQLLFTLPGKRHFPPHIEVLMTKVTVPMFWLPPRETIWKQTSSLDSQTDKALFAIGWKWITGKNGMVKKIGTSFSMQKDWWSGLVQRHGPDHECQKCCRIFGPIEATKK